jgi:hypothetical protein
MPNRVRLSLAVFSVCSVPSVVNSEEASPQRAQSSAEKSRSEPGVFPQTIKLRGILSHSRVRERQ